MTDVTEIWRELINSHRAWVLARPGAVAHADAQSWRRRWVDRKPVEFGIPSSDAAEISCWAYDMMSKVPKCDDRPYLWLCKMANTWPKQ